MPKIKQGSGYRTIWRIAWVIFCATSSHSTRKTSTCARTCEQILCLADRIIPGGGEHSCVRSNGYVRLIGTIFFSISLLNVMAGNQFSTPHSTPKSTQAGYSTFYGSRPPPGYSILPQLRFYKVYRDLRPLKLGWKRSFKTIKTLIFHIQATQTVLFLVLLENMPTLRGRSLIITRGGR